MTEMTPHGNDGLGFGPPDDRLIDRLVDGELSADERRTVLARLDAEPDGWRRCALAFLEGQSWREALGLLAAGSREPMTGTGRGGIRWRNLPRVRTLAAVAAGLLAAFALGWVARGGPSSGTPPAPLASAGTPALPQVPDVPRPSTADAPTHPAPGVGTPAPASLPEPLVRAWARRGFQVERSQRLVSMELKDGRRLPIPVDEVRLRYVGDRTY
jgi:hypothetical protein